MFPFLRLVAILIVVLLISASIIGGLRFLGLNQQFSAYSHPILKLSNVSIWKPLSQKKLSTKKFMNNHNLPLIKCQFLNNVWRVHFNKNKSTDLKKLLSQFSKKTFVLKIFSLEKPALFSLVQLLKNTAATTRVIISSPLAQIQRELRKIAPQLVFLGHFKEISQLSVMSILSIESLSSLQSDIYPIFFDRLKFLNKEISEIKRRKKKIIIVFKDKKLFFKYKKFYNKMYYGTFLDTDL